MSGRCLFWGLMALCLVLAGQALAQPQLQPSSPPGPPPGPMQEVPSEPPAVLSESFKKIRAKAEYRVYWAGFVVADVWSELVLSEESYKLDTAYRTRGILSFFSKAESETFAVGKIRDDGTYQPLLYKKQGHWGGTSYKHFIERDPENGAPLKISIYNEDHKWNREPVPEKYWSLVDPATYMARLLTRDRKRLLPGLQGEGSRTLGQIFNGAVAAEYMHHCPQMDHLEKRRKSLYEGKAVRCEFTARLLAGWSEEERERQEEREGQQHERDADPIEIWFAPWKDLPMMIPVQSRFKTGWGTATMYLTRLNIQVLLDDTAQPEEDELVPVDPSDQDSKQHREEFLDGNHL